MIVLNDVFCATRDVAIDSLAVSTLLENERARGNGFMAGGQCAGIALGGGGAVCVFGLWVDAALWYVSAVLLASLVFVLLFVWDPDVVGGPHRRLAAAAREFSGHFVAFIRELYRSFLKSGSGPRVGLLFAVVPTGAMVMAQAMLGTMQVDYGLSQNQITALSVHDAIAAATGCIAGGWLADRFGIKPLLGLFFALTAVPTLLLAGQISAYGLSQVALPLIYGTIIVHGLMFGMGYGVDRATWPSAMATQPSSSRCRRSAAGSSLASYTRGLVEPFDDHRLARHAGGDERQAQVVADGVDGRATPRQTYRDGVTARQPVLATIGRPMTPATAATWRVARRLVIGENETKARAAGSTAYLPPVCTLDTIRKPFGSRE